MCASVGQKSPPIAANTLQVANFNHLVAGTTAGVVSTLLLHPLDLIKVRLAVHDGHASVTPKYSGIGNAFATIWRQEGLRGLYRGVTPNIWGAGSSWGLYFYFYTALKLRRQRGNTQKPLSPALHLLAASEAGIATLLITNPLWVIKTRLCLQAATDRKPASVVYTGMLDAMRKIYQAEGLRGYYKGLLPGIFGVSHGAIQFMIYEELKNAYNHYRDTPITTKLGTAQYLSFAAVSKLAAAAATYPYQVVRARLQDQHRAFEGSVHCISQTWQFEGWRGFYKGLGTNLLRVTPATMITFATYEHVSHFLASLPNR